MLKRAGIVGAFFICALAMAAPAQAGPFGDWAAVVVAGDFHGSGGGPTEAFDNARRDVSKELQRLGFAQGNIVQFSVRPERYKDRPLKSDTLAIYRSLNDLSSRATSGCLVYFTSHGARQGVVVDQQILTPGLLARIGMIFLEFDLSLQNAKIATLGERVEDVFFITDANNQPLSDPQLCIRLQEAIVEQLTVNQDSTPEPWRLSI